MLKMSEAEKAGKARIEDGDEDGWRGKDGRAAPGHFVPVRSRCRVGSSFPSHFCA